MAITNPHLDHTSGLASPQEHGFAVTTSDSTDLAFVSRALWVGGAGAVKVTLLGGETVTLSGVPAGTLLPLRVSRVWATGTTATLILALY